MKSLQKIKEKRVFGLVLTVVMCMTCMTISTKAVHASGYDPQKAVAYADAWGGSKRNPAYNNYNGADCANYVSQCLYAGGLATGSDWQPYNLAWNTVTYMVRVMKARGYQVIENPTASQIYPGNPVIYQWKGETADWSHATICVGYDTNGTPIVNGHTTDRYHVAWNYGAGSANKMCTILINNGFTAQNPVNLGDSFYAYINSNLAGKPLTNDGSNVSIRSKGSSDEAIRSQVWKFVRQEDGSYVICSTKDDNVLDVDGGGTTGGTNVHTYHYWGHPAQHWYIYGSAGAYQLKAQCSDCLLDIANAEKADGTNVQMCMSNGNLAQVFDIVKVNPPGVAKVNCTPGTDKKATTIYWDATTDTSVYNVRISGSLQKDIWNLKTTSCQVELPAGNYEVYVDSCNAYSYTASKKIKFTVSEETVIVEEETPAIPEESNKVETSVIPEESNKTETPAVPEESNKTEAPTVPEESNRTETPVVPEESSKTETPAAPEESSKTETPSAPEENSETEMPTVSDESSETETPPASEESNGEDIPAVPSISITNQVDNSVKNTYISYIWNFIWGIEPSDTSEFISNIDQSQSEVTAVMEPQAIIESQAPMEPQVQTSLMESIEEAKPEIMAAETVEIEEKEDEESSVRFLWKTDEDGEFTRLFLKITFPYNEENQTLLIRIL